MDFSNLLTTNQDTSMFNDFKGKFKTPVRPTKPINLVSQKRKIMSMIGRHRFHRQSWVRRLFATKTQTFRIVSRYNVGDYCPELGRILTSPREGFTGQLTVILRIVIDKESSRNNILSTRIVSYWST